MNIRKTLERLERNPRLSVTLCVIFVVLLACCSWKLYGVTVDLAPEHAPLVLHQAFPADDTMAAFLRNCTGHRTLSVKEEHGALSIGIRCMTPSPESHVHSMGEKAWMIFRLVVWCLLFAVFLTMLAFPAIALAARYKRARPSVI